jgi:serine/threonine protein kinase
MTSVKIENSNFIEDQDLKKRFAVKIIRANDEELMEVAYEEYKLLRTLDHPNIVKMHDAFLN